jgi:hypothetical protein
LPSKAVRIPIGKKVGNRYNKIRSVAKKSLVVLKTSPKISLAK